MFRCCCFCVDVFDCFFFSSRRRHTRYWRDWSSDVCSSDLQILRGGLRPHPDRREPLGEQLQRLLVRTFVHPEDAPPRSATAQHPCDGLVDQHHEFFYELAGGRRAARPCRYGHPLVVYLVLRLSAAEFQLAPPGGSRLECARELVGGPVHVRQLHLPLAAQKGVHPLVCEPGVAHDEAPKDRSAPRLAVGGNLHLDRDGGPFDVRLEGTHVVGEALG